MRSTHMIAVAAGAAAAVAMFAPPADAQDKVRALYERMAAQKMKKRRAKFVFKKWLAFEESEGNARQVERVTAIAKEYVAKMQAAGDEEEEAE